MRFWLVACMLLAALVLQHMPCQAQATASKDPVEIWAEAEEDLAGGKLNQAIATFTRAIKTKKLDKKHLSFCYFGRGLAYHRKKDFNRAFEDYSKAIAVNKKHSGAYIHRGDIYMVQGRLDQALQDYNQATALSPRAANPYLRRSKLYLLQGKYERAIADAEMATRVDGDNEEAYEALSKAYEKAGQLMQSLEAMRTANRVSPSPKYELEFKRIQDKIDKEAKRREREAEKKIKKEKDID